jgi:hypothetical protein
MSKNEYMQDAYLGRETQALFTVTPEQYKNPDYDTDNSIGLTDNSATFVPTAKIGSVIGSSTVKITPIVVKKTGQLYDDIGRSIYIKQQEIPIVKHFGPDEINDIFNESMPASSGIGQAVGIGTGISAKLKEYYENNKDYYKNNENIDD